MTVVLASKSHVTARSIELPRLLILVCSCAGYTTSTSRTAKKPSQAIVPGLNTASHASKARLDRVPLHIQILAKAVKAHLEEFVEGWHLKEGRALRTEAVGNVCRMISTSDPDVAEMRTRRLGAGNRLGRRGGTCWDWREPLTRAKLRKRVSCDSKLTASKLRG